MGQLFDTLAVEVIEEPVVMGLLDLALQGLQVALKFLRGRYDEPRSQLTTACAGRRTSST